MHSCGQAGLAVNLGAADTCLCKQQPQVFVGADTGESADASFLFGQVCEDEQPQRDEPDGPQEIEETIDSRRGLLVVRLFPQKKAARILHRLVGVWMTSHVSLLLKGWQINWVCCASARSLGLGSCLNGAMSIRVQPKGQNGGFSVLALLCRGTQGPRG